MRARACFLYIEVVVVEPLLLEPAPNDLIVMGISIHWLDLDVLPEAQLR